MKQKPNNVPDPTLSAAAVNLRLAALGADHYQR
jgi:hypothetical protein